MKLLNLGCGATFDPAWTNVDISPLDPRVIRADLSKGIPFSDATFDAVYHSHVLEHLEREEGKKFVRESARVLKPRGILRVVVPDLEGICRTYLEKLKQCLANDKAAEPDYDWIMLELLDQTVRERSGGHMAEYLTEGTVPNRDFVISRIGIEGEKLIDGTRPVSNSSLATHATRLPAKALTKLKKGIGLACSRVLAGKTGAHCFETSWFRASGEVHRWMYDRFSLGRLLRETGLVDVRVCAADESSIPDFSRYELDIIQGRIRKPDSLFMEGIKPAFNS